MLGVDPADARPREWRERIGIVLQECEHASRSSPSRESLELYAGYYRGAAPGRRDDRARRASRTQRDQRAGALSGGQQRRLDVGAGADRRPGAPLPRRADDRLRPLRAPPGLGGDREPPGPRQDRLPDDALHGRGAGARRPRRDHRRRARSSPRARPTSSAAGTARRLGSASGSRRASARATSARACAAPARPAAATARSRCRPTTQSAA